MSAHAIVGSGTSAPRMRDHYDLFVAGAGAGPRCTYVSGLLPKGVSIGQRLALSYVDGERGDHHDLSEQQFEWYKYDLVRAAATGVRRIVADRVRSTTGTPISVGVDVTGLDRSRIAELVAGLVDSERNLEVDFFYAPAVYRSQGAKAARALVGRTESTAFKGELARADVPVSLILGLGYEPHVGVGAVEMIAPSQYWVFAPRGFDKSYDAAIGRRNGNLTSFFPPTAWQWYALERCEEVFSSLMSLTSAVIDESRVTVVPFGPRIFTATCCAVAAAFDGRVEIASVSTRGPWEDLANAHGAVSAFALKIRP